MRRRMLWLLVALLLSAVEARKHRYGQQSRQQQRVRRLDVVGQDEPTLESLEDDVIIAVSSGRRRNADTWPPKWSQPVVVAVVVWYSSFFF